MTVKDKDVGAIAAYGGNCVTALGFSAGNPYAALFYGGLYTLNKFNLTGIGDSRIGRLAKAAGIVAFGSLGLYDLMTGMMSGDAKRGLEAVASLGMVAQLASELHRSYGTKGDEFVNGIGQIYDGAKRDVLAVGSAAKPLLK
ncbi:hypothetical protein HYU23_02015 [Candidatus Woesearchaeota archaeon]|nr:hypothetical protein [Candidatus Woesearchaeota archaeon]